MFNYLVTKTLALLTAVDINLTEVENISSDSSVWAEKSIIVTILCVGLIAAIIYIVTLTKWQNEDKNGMGKEDCFDRTEKTIFVLSNMFFLTSVSLVVLCISLLTFIL